MFHFLPSRTKSNPASPSTCIGLSGCRQPRCLRRLCSRNALLSYWPYALGSSRIDSDLPDLLHHVNRVKLLNLQSAFRQLQNVKLVAPNRTCHVVCVLQSFACLLRCLKEPVVAIFRLLLTPSRSSPHIALNSSRTTSRIASSSPRRSSLAQHGAFFSSSSRP